MCVCMCVCVCVCSLVGIIFVTRVCQDLAFPLQHSTHTHTYYYTHMYGHSRRRTHWTHTHILTITHTCAHTYRHIRWIHTQIHAEHTHIRWNHMNTHAHTHTHTHTHTHAEHTYTYTHTLNTHTHNHVHALTGCTWHPARLSIQHRSGLGLVTQWRSGSRQPWAGCDIGACTYVHMAMWRGLRCKPQIGACAFARISVFVYVCVCVLLF
jgi:hypothetical protein